MYIALKLNAFKLHCLPLTDAKHSRCGEQCCTFSMSMAPCRRFPECTTQRPLTCLYLSKRHCFSSTKLVRWCVERLGALRVKLARAKSTWQRFAKMKVAIYKQNLATSSTYILMISSDSNDSNRHALGSHWGRVRVMILSMICWIKHAAKCQVVSFKIVMGSNAKVESHLGTECTSASFMQVTAWHCLTDDLHECCDFWMFLFNPIPSRCSMVFWDFWMERQHPNLTIQVEGRRIHQCACPSALVLKADSFMTVTWHKHVDRNVESAGWALFCQASCHQLGGTEQWRNDDPKLSHPNLPSPLLHPWRLLCDLHHFQIAFPNLGQHGSRSMHLFKREFAVHSGFTSKM